MITNPTPEQLITALYEGLFGRAPEYDGLHYWLDKMNQGQSFEQIATGFTQDSTYQAKVGGLSDTDFIKTLYNNVLGRDPVGNDLDYWTSQITTLGRDKVAATFVKNALTDDPDAIAKANGWSDTDLAAAKAAQTALQNKIEVGIYFAETLGASKTALNPAGFSNPALWANDPVYKATQDILKLVTADPASVTTAKIIIDTAASKAALQDAMQVIEQGVATGGVAHSLTTGVDSITYTDGNDVITGTVSAVKAEATFNPADQIDGGEGQDTLKLALKTGFNGMSGDGYVKNVETIDLTNAGTTARTFNTTGIADAQHYVLTGAVNLTELSSTSADVTLKNLAGGATATLGYASKVTDGKDDTQAIILDTVGTPASGSTAAKPATVKLAGIETVDLTVNNANVATLDASGAKALNINGAGTLQLGLASGSSITSVDGASASGALTLDLSKGAQIKEVATGSGDDTISVGSGSLLATATLDGGAGKDTLKITGNAGTAAYAMNGIETLVLDGATLTLRASDVSGLETIVVQGSGSGSLVSLGDADLTVQLDKTSATLTLDHAGATTVEVLGGTDKAPKTAAGSATFTQSADLTVKVDAYGTLGGTLTANKAQSVTLTGDGSVSGATLTAGAATSGTIDLAGGGDLTLKAAKLSDLTVTAAKGLTLNSTASTLSGVQNLTVNTGGAFTADDFSGVTTVVLSGTGSVQLGNLGSADNDYGLDLTATGLANPSGAAALKLGNLTAGKDGYDLTLDVAGVTGNVKIGDLTASGGSVLLDASTLAGDLKFGNVEAKNITIDASHVTGDVSGGTLSGDVISFYANGALGTLVDLGTITVGQSLTYDGADLTENKGDIVVTGSDVDLFLNGGLQNDSFTISDGYTGTAAQTLTLSGDLDIESGGDTVSLTLTGSGGAHVIDASGLKGVETIEVTGPSGGDFTYLGGAGADVLDLSDMTIGAQKVEIHLGADDGAEDTVTFGSTVGGTSPFHLYDFEAGSGSDVLKFVDDLLGSGGSGATGFTEVATGSVNADALTDTSSIGFYQVTGEHLSATEATNAADVWAVLAGSSTQTITSIDSTVNKIFLVDDGSDTYVWLFDSTLDGTSGEAASGDLKLIGVVHGVTDFAAGDVVIAS